MGRHVRSWKKCNIPAFLFFIIMAYFYFTATLLRGNMLLSLFLGTMTLVSLYTAALIHPGPVPDAWKHEQREAVRSHEWCKQCDSARPERAHHCHYCGECIVRYDHHCDWIDNCVGTRNHKLFFLFLLYISLSILHFLWMFVAFFRGDNSRTVQAVVAGKTKEVVNLVLLIFYCMIVIPCAIFAFSFLGCTGWMISRNETSFDRNVGSRHFGRGLTRNLMEVFGPNPLLWLVPTIPPVNMPLPQDGFDKLADLV